MKNCKSCGAVNPDPIKKFCSKECRAKHKARNEPIWLNTDEDG